MVSSSKPVLAMLDVSSAKLVASYVCVIVCGQDMEVQEQLPPPSEMVEAEGAGEAARSEVSNHSRFPLHHGGGHELGLL